jgi:hypothetical protein
MTFDLRQRAIIDQFREAAADLEKRAGDPIALRKGLELMDKIEEVAIADGKMTDLITWVRNKRQRIGERIRELEKNKKPYRK